MAEEGLTCYVVDTDGENMFFNIDGGYVILPFENVDVDTLKKYKTKRI